MTGMTGMTGMTWSLTQGTVRLTTAFHERLLSG